VPAEHAMLEPILEDWQFGGIVTPSTGWPFTVMLNTDVNNGALRGRTVVRGYM
jgi:hypothetical protein